MRREHLGGRANVPRRDTGRHGRERRVALGRGSVRGGERDRRAGLVRRRRSVGGSAVTLRERNDPGHQPFWRNLHPAAAACGRILHYAVPHRAYYPYYCCLTPAAAVALAAGCP